jgi:hypothetical protein
MSDAREGSLNEIGSLLTLASFEAIPRLKYGVWAMIGRIPRFPPPAPHFTGNRGKIVLPIVRGTG